MSKDQWELAGFTDSEGRVGKDVPFGRVIVPGTIELVEDTLHWEFEGTAKAVEISRSTLSDFVSLWRESPSAILRFARKWGVLVIQTCGTNGTTFRPCGEAISLGDDPIEAWRYFSHRAFAVLNIAAALKQGKLGDLDDWRLIASDCTKDAMRVADEQHRYGLGWHLFERPFNKQQSIDEAHRVVAREIQMWLSSWKGMRMRGLSDFVVTWSGSRWELRVDYHGFLFAAIALQLALSIAGADSLFSCSGCGVPYIRGVKKPKPGTDNYCAKCSRNGVAQRRAVDSYREIRGEAARLQLAGTPLTEIALRLYRSVQQIRKWCDDKRVDAPVNGGASRSKKIGSRKRK